MKASAILAFRRIGLSASAVLLTCALAATCPGQEPPSSLPDAPLPQSAGQAPSPDSEVALHKIPTDILHEQADIWTSPARIRSRELSYLLPLGIVTTVAMTTDHQVMSSNRLNNVSLNNQAGTASNALIGGFIATPVFFYGLGRIHHDDYASKTGILTGEAMVDAVVVQQAMKLATFRERPSLDNARGKFFQTSAGFDSSFPSSHSVVAWSAAAVIASNYNGPLTKITAYGLATGVSMTRVISRQHFPSDVIVGSAVGWLIGRYVTRKHHLIRIA